jgi:putative Mg2+ transporter-C (MgtC) family protein
MDIGVIPDVLLKILMAVLIGGIIGAEREYRDKAAGFRTMIFICTGAAMFTIFSMEIGGEEDPVRIASSIVSGVGFLGAGAIMRGEGRVMGLTTAATIWLTAALGMGVGGGYYEETAAATGIILGVLVLFPIFERWIDNIRDTRIYEVHTPFDLNLLEDLRRTFLESGLHKELRF